MPFIRTRISPCGFQVLSSLALFRLMNGVTVVSRPRFPSLRRRHRSARTYPLQGQSFPVHKVLSSTLLPGFTGLASSVLRVDLPPSVPLRFGFSSSDRFSNTCGSSRCQSSRASLGKTYRLPRYRPASRRIDTPDIRPYLATSAQPSPQRHIAGSLFITYPGSTSYFLQTRHL